MEIKIKKREIEEDRLKESERVGDQDKGERDRGRDKDEEDRDKGIGESKQRNEEVNRLNKGSLMGKCFK